MRILANLFAAFSKAMLVNDEQLNFNGFLLNYLVNA